MALSAKLQAIVDQVLDKALYRPDHAYNIRCGDLAAILKDAGAGRKPPVKKTPRKDKEEE